MIYKALKCFQSRIRYEQLLSWFAVEEKATRGILVRRSVAGKQATQYQSVVTRKEGGEHMTDGVRSA